LLTPERVNLNFSPADGKVNCMITVDQTRKTLAEHKEELRQNYQINEIGIYGSYVRGEQKRKAMLIFCLSLKILHS